MTNVTTVSLSGTSPNINMIDDNSGSVTIDARYATLFVQNPYQEIGDDEAAYGCRWLDYMQVLEIPMQVLLYLTENGIPFRMSVDGLIMDKTQLAVLLLKED